MAVGAGVVAAAYEAQGAERRESLTAAFQRRAELAETRLKVATGQLAAVQQRFEVGTASNEALLEARVKVAEADVQVRLAQLQLEEIRVTGQEPLEQVSAPLASGRDFVSQRLKLEMTLPEKAIELERARLREAQRRFEVGVADATDINASRARLLELEASLAALQKKIEIRQQFLADKLDATETELRVLESEAAARHAALQPQIDLARKEVERVKAKVEVGIEHQVAATQALLRLLELESELAKASLDLAVVRKRIEERKAGR
jgi:outer membrane protein TolC